VKGDNSKTMSEYEHLINQMTLEEKASLLSGQDFWRTRAIERLEIPAMALADGPHGLRKQAGEGDHLGLVEGVKATCFPTSATVANSWDEQLCEEIGQALGKEAAFHDVNILLGPGINIKRNPLCGRNFEYFSEDPYLSGKLGAGYVRGIQSNGVGACLKHFAANNQEYLRMTNDSVVDDRTLREIYLTGFEIAVKEGLPKAVMSSYNKINGIYANENSLLLRETLVNNWGFSGIVVSDWGGSNDAVKGIKAGAHLEMPTTGRDSIDQIIEGVKNGLIDEAVLNERVGEYLRIVYETKINEKVNLDYEEHHRLAKKAAEASVVMLKNDAVLPIKTGKVAIIGDFAENPRYQGAGSSMVNPYKLSNTLESVKDTDLDFIGFARGYRRSGESDESLKKEALDLAKKADIVLIYMGLNEVNEVEGHDRAHMKLPLNQLEMVKDLSKTRKKIIAILSCGAAVEMSWTVYCDAVLHGYLSGQNGAKAMLDVLCGKVNPSGKLSESYPIQYEDCPSFQYYPGEEKTSEYREGLYVGYRYYDKVSQELQYPFGFGMSYTTFEYKDIQIHEDRVLCKVKNTGNVAGSEIVQLYVGKDQTVIHRPEKELKGFKKVFLLPKETVEITIPFDEYTFRYYDVSKKSFSIEKGEYRILIGSSSRDIRLSGTLFVQGTDPKSDDRQLLSKYFTGDVNKISKSEFETLYGRSLPNPKWDRSRDLELNDSLSQMVYAKSFLARIAIKVLIGLRNRSFKKGKPDLNLFFLSTMPFRAIAKMSDGNFSIKMTKELLVIVNGHFFKGFSGLIRSYSNYRKRGKK